MRFQRELDTLRRKVKELPEQNVEQLPMFPDWLTENDPDKRWDWPHMNYIVEHLLLLVNGHIKKLMIFLPPRHAKTALVTIRFVAWYLLSNPAHNVILGAYNQDLANRFSRSIRRIVRHWMPLNEERQSASEWETSAGGGLRAAGVGSGVTGIGANLIIIDDPVKSREEVKSAAYRDRVWEWYATDVTTRLEPDASIILIMTRWGEDDLAGRILSSADGPNWSVISLPAEAEQDDPLGREMGEPLWRERYDSEALAERRTVLGINYYALYQQRPMPQSGGMFKREWFEIVPAAPTEAIFVRYWDKAATQDGGAYTCGVLLAKNARLAHFTIVDVVRGQWSAQEREQIMRQTAEVDQQKYGRVAIWIEQEPGSGGKESAEATIRNLAGFNVRA
ncbi:MAG: terminase family protein, partial [Anaerolineales bacterium]|nr:terminase family protein [Anaerolineales bacterium]